MKKQFFFPVIVLFLTVTFAYGSDQRLRQFAIYATPSITSEKCALTERRSHSDLPIVKFDGFVNRGECQVFIGKEKYEQLFQFCFMSGVNLYKAVRGNSFECFLQERDDDYIFMASISKESGKNSQLMCYFSCIVNSKTNNMEKE